VDLAATRLWPHCQPYFGCCCNPARRPPGFWVDSERGVSPFPMPCQLIGLYILFCAASFVPKLWLAKKTSAVVSVLLRYSSYAHPDLDHSLLLVVPTARSPFLICEITSVKTFLLLFCNRFSLAHSVKMYESALSK
jgi:hypothetical protein